MGPIADPGIYASPQSWRPGQPVPLGYRVRYERSAAMLIGGGSALALGYTVTTLVAAGIASSGLLGNMFAIAGTIPVVGAFPLAGLAGVIGAGPGTVATLVALGVTQSVGFGVLIAGLAKRKPAGIVPVCDTEALRISPLVSPQTAGIAIGGSL